MIVQQIVNGLTLGSIYALLALGYSMIFGVLQFINFAHGGVAMVGAYITWYMAAKVGLPVILAAVVGFFGAMVLGLFIERVGYRPLRKAPKLSSVIVSM